MGGGHADGRHGRAVHGGGVGTEGHDQHVGRGQLRQAVDVGVADLVGVGGCGHDEFELHVVGAFAGASNKARNGVDVDAEGGVAGGGGRKGHSGGGGLGRRGVGRAQLGRDAQQVDEAAEGVVVERPVGFERQVEAALLQGAAELNMR